MAAVAERTKAKKATAPVKAYADLLAKGLLTVSNAVMKFGIGRSRLYLMMEAGRLPYSQIGKRRLIPVVALEEMIRDGLVGVDVSRDE